jgi:hypothetical protein
MRVAITGILVERRVNPAQVEELSEIGETAANPPWTWQRACTRHRMTMSQAVRARSAA